MPLVDFARIERRKVGLPSSVRDSSRLVIVVMSSAAACTHSSTVRTLCPTSRLQIPEKGDKTLQWVHACLYRAPRPAKSERRCPNRGVIHSGHIHPRPPMLIDCPILKWCQAWCIRRSMKRARSLTSVRTSSPS